MEEALTPAEFRAVWDSKPVLRAVYGDYYRRIAAWCRPGLTLEVGAGSGNLKEILPEVVSSDIVACPWLDAVVDAQALPFADGSLANIVGVDVLHHVQLPRQFLSEARRVLAGGGRVVLVEPAITPVSWAMFKLGHPEPIDMGADPLSDGARDPDKHPMDSNQAIPTLLAGRYRRRLEHDLPGLKVAHVERLSLFAYPLSGGFRPWNLLPEKLVAPVLRLEEHLAPALARVMGFRLLLVLQRDPAEPGRSTGGSGRRSSENVVR